MNAQFHEWFYGKESRRKFSQEGNVYQYARRAWEEATARAQAGASRAPWQVFVDAMDEAHTLAAGGGGGNKGEPGD